MDEKLFIRFQETENGSFPKRIGVDRALLNMYIFINSFLARAHRTHKLTGSFGGA